MGLGITIDNYDTLFKKTEKFILVNNLSMLDREQINDNLQVTLDEADISTIPSCGCGEVVGRVYADAGVICSNCGEEPTTIIDADYPIMWFGKLTKTKLLNPQFVLMFNSTLGSKVNYFRWLTDESYKVEGQDPVLIAVQNIKDFNRSYDFFVNHMKDILVVASNVSKLKKPATLEKIEALIWMIDNQGHVILSDNLPIMSKSLFIMENTSIGKFSDMVVSSVIDTTLNFIAASRNKDIKALNSTTSKLIAGLAQTLEDYYKQRLNGKKKFIRAHINGLRAPGSRSVMTLLYGKNDYNSVTIPWQAFLGSYRYEITNLLINRYGYHYLQAINLIDTHFFREHPTLREIANTLISECKYKGLPIRTNRNQQKGFILTKVSLTAA